MGTVCGYHTAPAANAMRRIPPNNGRDKRSELGGGVWVSRRPRRLCCKKKNPPLGGIIQLERGGMWISRRLVLAVAGKNPPQTKGEIKKLERSGVWDCTPLVRVWKAKRDGVWDAHRLVHVFKPERAGVWGAHRLAGCRNDTAGGRGHKRPPPHPRFPFRLLPPPPSTSYSRFCPLRSLSLRDVAFAGGRLCRV